LTSFSTCFTGGIISITVIQPPPSPLHAKSRFCTVMRAHFKGEHVARAILGHKVNGVLGISARCCMIGAKPGENSSRSRTETGKGRLIHTLPLFLDYANCIHDRHKRRWYVPTRRLMSTARCKMVRGKHHKRHDWASRQRYTWAESPHPRRSKACFRFEVTYSFLAFPLSGKTSVRH